MPLRDAHGHPARGQARGRREGIGGGHDTGPALPTRVPQGRSARRQLHDARNGRRSAGEGGRYDGRQAPPHARRARFVDRRAPRRSRHRVLRQDGHGPGRRRRDRPDRRRRAGRGVRSRRRRHGRHRVHLQPGRRVRQHRRAARRRHPPLRGRRGAPHPARSRGREALGGGGAAHRAGRSRLGRRRSAASGELWRVDQRPALPSQARVEQAVREPTAGEGTGDTQDGVRIQDRRDIDTAADRRRQGIRRAPVCHRRQGRRHAPCACCPAADGRLRPGHGRRVVDRRHSRGSGHSRERPGGRGRRARVGRGARGGHAQGDLGTTLHAVPADGDAARAHPPGEADRRRSPCQQGRRGNRAQDRASVDRGGVRMAAAVAREHGPACAVADVRADQATLWTGSQKPHYGRNGVAKLVGLPPEKVRAVWVPGPGSYGRNDAGDAALDAALLSKLTGRPVRVQYMRHEGTGWDPKGPAAVYRARAGLDAQGTVVAYDFFGKGFTRQDVATTESDPKDTLAGQLTGYAPKPTVIFQVPAEAYDFANKRCGWECIAPLLDRGSPLRTGHLRDPLGPETHFASESFIDEVAHAAGVDPVAFRLKYVSDARHVAVITAAAEKAGWTARPYPNPRRGKGNVMTGRGVSYAERNGTIVAVAAEVEVDRRGRPGWVQRFTVAHDCGLIINPKGLELTIEGNVVQAVSRTLFEEVAFDRNRVLSVDWASYPILEIQDAPERIDIVLINRPDVASSGAGEPSTRTVPAAIANAIFDATGVRLRRVPITPERIRAALARA